MATADQVMEFMKSTMRLRRLAPDSAIGRERGWDSMNHVQLMLAFEGEYGIAIPADRFGELTDVPKILGFLRERGVVA